MTHPESLGWMKGGFTLETPWFLLPWYVQWSDWKPFGGPHSPWFSGFRDKAMISGGKPTGGNIITKSSWKQTEFVETSKRMQVIYIYMYSMYYVHIYICTYVYIYIYMDMCNMQKSRHEHGPMELWALEALGWTDDVQKIGLAEKSWLWSQGDDTWWYGHPLGTWGWCHHRPMGMVKPAGQQAGSDGEERSNHFWNLVLNLGNYREWSMIRYVFSSSHSLIPDV